MNKQEEALKLAIKALESIKTHKIFNPIQDKWQGTVPVYTATETLKKIKELIK